MMMSNSKNTQDGFPRCTTPLDRAEGFFRPAFLRCIALLLVVSAISSIHAQALVSSGQPSGGQETRSGDQVKILGREAEQDLLKRDYAGAIEKYERLASLQPDSANVLNNLGLAYHMAGKPREAIRALQKALRLKPEMLSANLILGMDYVQLNDAAQAIAPLERALRQDPNNRDALFALATAHLALKHFDLAAQAYQREIKVRPDDADAWYGMGLCYEHIAESTSRKLSETAGQSSFNQRLSGEFMIERDKGVEAEEAFHRAIAAAPEKEREGLHAGLGFAHLRLGEVDRAKDQFQVELQANPGNLEARLGLAAAALEQQEWPKAIERLCDINGADSGFLRSRLDFFATLLTEQTAAQAMNGLDTSAAAPGCSAAIERVRNEMNSAQPTVDTEDAFGVFGSRDVKVRPPEPQVMVSARRDGGAGRYAECARTLQPFKLQNADEVLLLTRCQAMSGQYLMAFGAVHEVLKAHPENPEALYWQAEATRMLAQTAMQSAVSLNSDSWQGQLLLGDLFRQRRKWDVAISHYQSAARLKPDSPGPLIGLATVHWNLGQNAEAEAALKRALKMAPENLSANFELGDVYVRMRRFDEAVPYLERSLAREPGNLAAHGDLGKAFAALNRNKEAVAELTEALPTDEKGELHYQLYLLYKKDGKTSLAQEALAKSEELRAREREDVKRRLDRTSPGK
jgi:tetratricopeptide (TPR) repeat protein